MAQIQSRYCECEWTYHQGQRCHHIPHQEPDVVSSAALCTPCLFICEREREDAQLAAKRPAAKR